MTRYRQRTFIIGDEWIYFKIYAGPQILESILVNEICESCDKLLEYSLIDKFFFIRYADPEYHLRIRFHVPITKNILTVIELLNKNLSAYVNKKIIWRLCIEPYTRELERYGYDTIDEVETLFHYESTMVISFLKNTIDFQCDSIRWFWAIKFIDNFLSGLNFTIEDKTKYASTMKNAYANEFSMDKSLKIQLDKKYRSYRTQIEQIFTGTNQTIIDWTYLIYKYVENTKPLMYSINQTAKNRNKRIEIIDLTGSLIHMFINRLFRTNQRIYELIIYYFMDKYYSSHVARLKYSNEMNSLK